MGRRKCETRCNCIQLFNCTVDTRFYNVKQKLTWIPKMKLLMQLDPNFFYPLTRHPFVCTVFMKHMPAVGGLSCDVGRALNLDEWNFPSGNWFLVQLLVVSLILRQQCLGKIRGLTKI